MVDEIPSASKVCLLCITKSYGLYKKTVLAKRNNKHYIQVVKRMTGKQLSNTYIFHLFFYTIFFLILFAHLLTNKIGSGYQCKKHTLV